MRAQARVVAGWAAAVLVVVGFSGCSDQIAGVAGTDSSSAFSVFLRPQGVADVVPTSLWTPLDTTPTVPDVHTSRKVATSKTLAVYLVHAAPDSLCIVVQELPGQSAGSQGCGPGPNVTARGMVLGWGGDMSDPTSDHTAVAVPDGYTASIDNGTFELAGQNVLVVQGDGVELTLTSNDGEVLRLSSPARSQR